MPAVKSKSPTPWLGCSKTQDIYGYRYEGTRFDCGNKAGFQMANLSFSMDRLDMRDQLLSFMRELIEKY